MSTSNPPIRAVAAWKLWLVAWTLAACETWTNVDARAGLNWSLTVWTTALALVAFRWLARKPPSGARLVALLLGCLIAGGIAVTTGPGMLCLALIGTACALGLGAQPDRESQGRLDAGLGGLLSAPTSSTRVALGEAKDRFADASRSVHSSRGIPIVRGILLATPITLAFAWLLSNADPLFQYWRMALLTALEDGSFLIRTLWFCALGFLALGLVGASIKVYPSATDREDNPTERRLALGSVERLIILASVAGLFALFLGMQLSHLFADTASIPGSGVTYAQAAHEGFGELTVAASLCAALLITLTRSAGSEPRGPLERAANLVLVVESQFLLVSAFHKVDLYENVFGFTELRLLVQAYAAVVFIALAQLGVELLGQADFRRLARHCAVTVALVLIGLLYWNHVAWIARANFERYETRNILDVDYVAYSLGPDAVPEVLQFLPRLPAALQGNVRSCLRERYPSEGNQIRPQHWYEWNYRRARFRTALERDKARAQSSLDPSLPAVPSTCT